MTHVHPWHSDLKGHFHHLGKFIGTLLVNASFFLPKSPSILNFYFHNLVFLLLLNFMQVVWSTYTMYSFLSSCFGSTKYLWNLSMSLHIFIDFPYLLLSHISLYECGTTNWFIFLLLDFFFPPSLGLLQIVMLWTFMYVQVSLWNICTHFSRVMPSSAITRS